jgi:hypothetical protein
MDPSEEHTHKHKIRTLHTSINTNGTRSLLVFSIFLRWLFFIEKIKKFCFPLKIHIKNKKKTTTYTRLIKQLK